jgi:hypothetical protein
MVLLPPPLFPGLLGPLEAAVGGLAGEGQTPRSGPRLGTPPAAYLSTPGRPPSPRLPLRGLCGDPRGSAATLCGPAPAPGPSGAFPCAKASFRADGGLSPPPALPVPWERRCYRRRSHGRQRGLPTSLLLSPEAALARWEVRLKEEIRALEGYSKPWKSRKATDHRHPSHALLPG